HGGGDLGAADHEDLGSAAADFPRQRVFLEIGLVDHVAAGGPQAVDPTLFEFVGYEYLHPGSRFKGFNRFKSSVPRGRRGASARTMSTWAAWSPLRPRS